MTIIDVDFEVFKELTIRRRSEEMTENEVLRQLLGLAPSPKPSQAITGHGGGQPWVVKGVSFPSGTLFRATHIGRQYSAEVKNGALVYNGKRYKSPSAASGAITKKSSNGWIFWECLLPGATRWKLIKELRQ